VGTPDQLSPQEEVQQLRSRIAELEEEISQIHRDDAEWLSAFDRQYRDVFDNLSVCMFLVDVTSDGNFKFVAFNPAEEKAVGLSTADVCGKSVEDVFAEDLAQKLTANYRRCLEAQGPITYDDELNLPRGKRYFHSNLIPLRDTFGNIHRIVGACIDMTEFKRTQEHALATQKLESLGVMASGIAHDLNNLLGTIAVESEVLMEELEENLPARESLFRIEAVSGRASEIMRQLMVYAVPESANLEPIDLVGLVKEMVQLMKVSISKSATLEVALPDQLPMILANASQIRQIVLNLITNASEALEGKGGVISVTVREVHFDGEFLPDQRPNL
jgi:PAS domain S-box-containing protein